MTFADDLKNYFKKFGDVLSAYVVKNYATGKSKGFGFVEYFDRESAKKVIEIQFHVIKGVKMSCSLYLKRGKKYHKEFKELENKVKNKKFQNKRSRSYQFLNDIDASKSQNSSNQHDSLNLNHSYRGPGSHRGSGFFSGSNSHGRRGQPFSSDNSSFYNSNSVASGGNFLVPPDMRGNMGDMRSGLNFQQNAHQQLSFNPQQSSSRKQSDYMGKRMSLDPYATREGENMKNFQMKIRNRRSLFTNHQEDYNSNNGNAGFPTITINNYDGDDHEGNNYHPGNFAKSPTSSQYSGQDQGYQNFGQNSWKIPQNCARSSDLNRKMTLGTQQTGDRASNYDKNFMFPGVGHKAEEEIFNRNPGSHLSGISNLSIGEVLGKKKKKKSAGFDLLPPPVSPDLVERGAKARVKSHDFGTGEGGSQRIINSKEKDDSFDENELLKECFDL